MTEPIATVGDLAGICGSEDDDTWEKILIDASRRLVVAIAAFSAALEVTQDTPGDLLVGSHHYDGAAWRKANLLWGYHDRYFDDVTETSVGDTYTYADCATVPSGEVWVVTVAHVHHNDPTARNTAVEVTDGTDVVTLAIDSSLAQLERITWSGMCVMKEDDYLRGRVTNLAAAKLVRIGVAGYKMDISM